MHVGPFVNCAAEVFRTVAFCLVIAVPLAGCGSSSADDDGLEIVTSFYPLTFLAREVAGDGARVTDLTPPGAEPHDIELTARQVVDASEADLLLYLGGDFQPVVSELATSTQGDALDALESLPAKDKRAADPHVWLAPMLMASLGDELAERLATVHPEHASSYRQHAVELSVDLEELDRDFQEGLEKCSRRELVVSHEAFGYLADCYGLIQTGIAGLDPEAEPSPSRLAEVADYARRHAVTTIFFETLVSPRVAEALARETGAEVASLDPLEGEPGEGDYFTVMRANLQVLRQGLGCP